MGGQLKLVLSYQTETSCTGHIKWILCVCLKTTAIKVLGHKNANLFWPTEMTNDFIKQYSRVTESNFPQGFNMLVI